MMLPQQALAAREICQICKAVPFILPRVPEPQTLNERNIGKRKRRGRGKERGDQGVLSPFIFSFYYFLALVPRVVPFSFK